jgi:RIO kinase 1
VMIDLPQVVDLVANPRAPEFLHRDCTNICTWFERRGIDAAQFEFLYGDLMAEAVGSW